MIALPKVVALGPEVILHVSEVKALVLQTTFHIPEVICFAPEVICGSNEPAGNNSTCAISESAYTGSEILCAQRKPLLHAEVVLVLEVIPHVPLVL